MKKVIIIVLLLNSILSYSQIDSETNFYNEIDNVNYDKNLVTDYGVDNDFSTDDSANIQDAINEISTNGGGTLTIPKGNYSFGDVNLNSNVHIKIDEGVVIRPFYEIPTDGKLKNYAIFKLGTNTDPIQNISITSSSENRFKVDLTHNNNPNIGVVSCGKVSNFIISNINVIDSFTKFSAITFGGDLYNGNYIYPENGIVKDIDIQDAHYGYGTVQTQSAENILFKDISGTGGATLRLETGFTGLNNLQGNNLPSGVKRIGGIHKIVARNISSKNGNSALMISPHSMHNGTIDAEQITSVNSGFTVRIEAGFISNKYDQDIGLTDGTFESVRVKNVHGTFGNSAEIKSKHFKFYPSEITAPTTIASYINSGETSVYIGPSIAVVLAETNYNCTSGVKTMIVEEPIVGVGFQYQEDLIPEEYLTVDCAALSTDKNLFLEDDFQVYPNPASKKIHFSISKGATIRVYNSLGKQVKVEKNAQENPTIDISKLPKGFYFVSVLSKGNINSKKIIIE